MTDDYENILIGELFWEYTGGGFSVDDAVDELLDYKVSEKPFNVRARNRRKLPKKILIHIDNKNLYERIIDHNRLARLELSEAIEGYFGGSLGESFFYEFNPRQMKRPEVEILIDKYGVAQPYQG